VCVHYKKTVIRVEGERRFQKTYYSFHVTPNVFRIFRTSERSKFVTEKTYVLNPGGRYSYFRTRCCFKKKKNSNSLQCNQ
jgi:hypothetical protein